MRRFAIYVAPDPESELGRFGAHWLGRDAASGRSIEQMPLAGFAADRLRSITASPRRYGFHGTMKAPFELADGRSAEELHVAVQHFARDRMAITIETLVLRSLGGFWALVPAKPHAALADLAAACVTELEPFRAPLSRADIERRLASGLRAGQTAYLERYGYPHIFEYFRFHLTLTERLSGDEHDAAGAALEPLVKAFTTAPFTIDAIAVFEQESRDRPFLMTGRYTLGEAGGQACAPKA